MIDGAEESGSCKFLAPPSVSSLSERESAVPSEAVASATDGSASGEGTETQGERKLNVNRQEIDNAKVRVDYPFTFSFSQC